MLKISKNISTAATDVLLPSAKLARTAVITQKCQPPSEAISALKEHVLTHGGVLAKTPMTAGVPELTSDPEVGPDLWCPSHATAAPFLTPPEPCGAGKDEVLRES